MDEPSTDSILGQALSDADAPTPPEPAPTPPAAAPVAPAVTPSESEPGPSVDPLVNRLKALGATDRDLEEVRRHYDGYSKSRASQAPAPAADPWKAVADGIFARRDPSERQEHEDFRRQYGDEAYVVAVHRMDQASPDAEPEPEPDEQQKAMQAAIAKAVEQALAERLGPYEPALAETAQERARAKLQKDLEPLMEAQKVPPHIREFLREDIHREIVRVSREDANSRLTLSDIFNQRWSVLKPALDSERKAAIDALRVTTQPPSRPAPAPAGSEPPKSSDEDESTVDGILGPALKRAYDESAPEGAA